ncbi:hypothetical protein [Burkholderia ubonensis]|uniref:hypothetical protein n=1 Tax=Burkholderia ubonensis TaxID=101571 RepID=UPI001E3BDE4E|nr:hypothetical protein [Burkholderia ubonensis]
MAALLPERARRDLRRAHFREPGLPHPFPNIFLDDAIKRHSARMPENGAGTFILLVKQIELVAEHAVIESIHHVLHSR